MFDILDQLENHPFTDDKQFASLDDSSISHHFSSSLQIQPFDSSILFLSSRISIRNYFWQFLYLCQRTFYNILRNPSLFTFQILTVILYGIFTGLIFHQLDPKLDPGVQNRFGAIFFIISCQLLTSITALETLIKEKTLFIHVIYT